MKMLVMVFAAAVLLSGSVFANCGKSGLNISVSGKRVQATQDGLKIKVRYHKPHHDGFLQMFSVDLAWNVKHECVETLKGRVAKFTISGVTTEEIRCGGFADSQTVVVSFPSKSFKFKNSEICHGMNYDMVMVNNKTFNQFSK